MSIKVSEHLIGPTPFASRGLAILHHKENSRLKQDLILFDVYTSDEVNTKIIDLQKLIMDQIIELNKSLNSTNDKLENQVQKIFEAIGDIPMMIMADEEFRSSIKKEILEEIRRELVIKP